MGTSPDSKLRGLIPTGPVEPDADDLGHRETVDTLHRLIRTVTGPTTIALYGRWGSGKSSVAKALAAALTSEQFRWVHYDAFKWSGDNFHRHFLLEVDRQLKTEVGPEFAREDTAVELVETQVIAATMRRVLGWLVILIIALVLLDVAVTQARDFFDVSSSSPLASSALSLVTPTALVAGFAVIGKNLLDALGRGTTRTLRIGPPSTGEAFEDLFKAIVTKARTRSGVDLVTPRFQPPDVVIFIDELDRCGPGDVVGTLDAIRTFMNVDGVIVIVAADREAVEAAISKEIAQTTPRDPDHPYYSSGGAVLDKIFAHTVELPIPRPKRLSRYARDLAANAGGIWDDLHDRDRVVTTLIPEYVRSPRRVKTLLNAYVVAYHTMLSRIDSGLVTGPASSREAELAKLVALNVEFPLFARLLSEYSDMPDRVVAASTAQDEPTYDKRATARLVALNRGLLRVRTDVVPASSDTAASEATDDEAEDDSHDDEDPPASQHRGEDSAEHGGEAVGVNQPRAGFDQLRTYLRTTKAITNPRPDLIYMEAFGAVYDLPPGVSIDVIAAAVRNDPDAIDGAVGDTDRAAVLQALANMLTSPEFGGVETDNLLHQTLAMVHRWGPEVTDGPVAGQLLNSLRHIFDQPETLQGLDETQVAALLRLIGEAGADTRRAEARAVLNEDSTIGTGDAVDDVLLAHISAFHAIAGDRVTPAVAHALTTEASATVARDLASRAPDALVDAAVSLRTHLRIRRDDRWVWSIQGIKHVASALPELEDRTPALDALTFALVGLGASTSRREALGHIDRVTPTHDSATLDGLVSAAALRDPHRWIAAVDWDTLAIARKQEILNGFTQAAVTYWWGEASGDPDVEIGEAVQQEVHDTVAALKEIRHDHDLTAVPFSMENIPEDRQVTGPPTTVEQAHNLHLLLELLHIAVADHDLCDATVINEELGSVVTAWASQRLLPPRQRAQQTAFTEQIVATHDVVFDTINYLRTVDAVPADLHPTDESDLPDDIAVAIDVAANPGEVVPATIANSLKEEPGRFARPARVWIETTIPDAAALQVAVAPLATTGDATNIVDAVTTWSAQADPSDVAEFGMWAALTPDVSRRLLQAISPSRLDPARAAELLIVAWQQATNNDDRAVVFDAWKWASEQLTPDAARTLVTEILHPMLTLAATNQGAAKIVVSHHSVIPHPLPYGTKQKTRELGDAVVKEHREVYDAFRSAGIATERKSLTRRLLSR